MTLNKGYDKRKAAGLAVAFDFRFSEQIRYTRSSDSKYSVLVNSVACCGDNDALDVDTVLSAVNGEVNSAAAAEGKLKSPVSSTASSCYSLTYRRITTYSDVNGTSTLAGVGAVGNYSLACAGERTGSSSIGSGNAGSNL